MHIVQVGSTLIASLGEELDDQSVLSFQDDLGARVVQTRASGVLMDVSALDVVDSFVCKVLSDSARIVRVFGADVVVVGMRPAVAITMVELGLSLDRVATARNIDDGMNVLADLAAAGVDGTGDGGLR